MANPAIESAPLDSRAVTPLPSTLWYQAHDEHPNDPDARTARYLDLMREHGHIVKREAGDDRPLFPCGYEPRRD